MIFDDACKFGGESRSCLMQRYCKSSVLPSVLFSCWSYKRSLQEGTQLFLCLWSLQRFTVFTSFTPWETLGILRFEKGKTVLILMLYIKNEIKDETVTQVAWRQWRPMKISLITVVFNYEGERGVVIRFCRKNALNLIYTFSFILSSMSGLT